MPALSALSWAPDWLSLAKLPRKSMRNAPVYLFTATSSGGCVVRYMAGIFKEDKELVAWFTGNWQAPERLCSCRANSSFLATGFIDGGVYIQEDVHGLDGCLLRQQTNLNVTHLHSKTIQHAIPGFKTWHIWFIFHLYMIQLTYGIDSRP